MFRTLSLRQRRLVQIYRQIETKAGFKTGLSALESKTSLMIKNITVNNINSNNTTINNNNNNNSLY